MLTKLVLIMINIEVLGYGYWGLKVVRDLMKIDVFILQT